MSEGRATAQSPSPPFPPLFEPDPELIDHLEGNRFFLRLYRKKAEVLRAMAQSEAAVPGRPE
jgi:hypothetical protein